MVSFWSKSTPSVQEEQIPSDHFFHKIREHSLSRRQLDSSRVLNKYPNRIPVIVDRGDNKTNSIGKHKYLVPKECTLGEFQAIIRAKIHLSSTDALFCYVGKENVLCRMTDLMNDIYAQHADEDGFLYITYLQEATFG
jgi:GABA(A) receptor-associated protein